MATSSGEVTSLPSEEEVERALGTDADPGSGVDLVSSDGEVDIELLHTVDELQYKVRYRLPQKIGGLVFRRETVSEDEVAAMIRRKYQKRFEQSFDEVDSSEAFRKLKQGTNTRMLNWESQVEECVAEEGDEFWIAVSCDIGS